MSILIPTWVKFAAAGVGAVVCFGAGWTTNDWRHDSKALTALETAAKKLDDARVVVDNAATAYEKDRQNAGIVREAGERTIRETYRERVVPADCAVAAPAVGVLNDAVAAANARASGQPAPVVPAPVATAGAADRP